MRAFVQTGIGHFDERDVPPPRAGRGEVVLRVLAALTCGTDRKLLERGHPRIALPVTMGHEACGEIAEVGEGVEGFRTGDRVVPGISGPCGRCADCRRGFENLCAPGHGDRTWGAFADLLRVPASVVARNLHPVPDGMADETAAFLDPLASVLHGWSRLNRARGRLLVYGAGALGLLWAATARLRGVSTIGSFHYSPEEAREAMRMLSSGEIDPAPLVTDRGALSDLPRFLSAEKRREGIRYAVFP